MTNLRGTSDLQQLILELINNWAHKHQVPISRKEVMRTLTKSHNKETVNKALKVLVSKGYLRHSVTISNCTSYVLLRSI